MKLFLFYASSSIILFSTVNSVQFQGLHAPLTVAINKTRLIVADIRKYVDGSNVLTENIILACPSELEFEEDINAKSNTKTSLIIRKFLKKGSSYLEKNFNNICKNEIMPSVIWDPKIETYNVGYEIVDANDLIEKALEEMKKPEFFQGDFHWVQIYGVCMKYYEDLYKFASYTPYPTDTTSVLSPSNLCEKFEALENENNSKISLRHEKLDSLKENEIEFSRKEEETIYLQTNDEPLLKKVYLVEPQDFDTYYSKLSTCFEINVTAMWETVFNKAWKKVGSFMRKVNNKLSKKGEIAFFRGMDGIITKNTNLEPEPILLSQKTPVPERFLNLISFSGEDKTLYGIFIVIHNNVKEKMNRLCEEDVCTKYGWEVGNDDFHHGETYCCEPA